MVIPIAIAQAPPFIQVYVGNELGLEIEYPKIITLQQDKNYTFNFHVYNKSDGYPMTNETVGCAFHLYDDIGEHTISYNSNGQMEFTEDYDFEIYVDENNFTETGDYSYIFQCNNSWQGGFVSANMIVTYNGENRPSDFTKVIFIVGFIILLSTMIITLMRIIGHFIEFDTDFMDVAYAYCVYFAVFAFKSFNTSYGGNYLIDTFMDVFIKFGAITHIFLPLIALILSITIGEWFRMQRKEKKRLKQHG